MRQPRDKRRPGVQIRLSSRDEGLFRALARFRMARTSDLANLIFRKTRRDTAARRLRRLYDAGFLDVISSDLAAENVYTLGRRGREWAAAREVAVGRRPRESAHHLAVVRTWVSLAVAASESAGLRLEAFRPDWELRGHALPVVPDAMVVLRVTVPAAKPPELRICVEVDRGTESLRVLEQKLSTYVLASLSPEGLLGWQDFALLLVLEDRGAERTETVEAMLGRVWPGRTALCLGGGLGQVGDALQRLVEPPLVRSPYREGRDNGASTCRSTTTQVPRPINR